MTNIFKQVAERNGTTEQEVREEIALALQLAGIKENPEKFIKNIAAQIKERTNYNKQIYAKTKRQSKISTAIFIHYFRQSGPIYHSSCK